MVHISTFQRSSEGILLLLRLLPVCYDSENHETFAHIDSLLTLVSPDPVFFLHHTQLDRLWWLWQQADIQKRRTEYLGKASRDSVHFASLEDSIPMGGLSTDIKVRDIMVTEMESLCYRY